MMFEEFGNYIDPIHGSIPYSENEFKLIQHPIFQRLKYIKQLGTVYRVYPSAIHTRFAHSLGVMHMSRKIFNSLLRKKINFQVDHDILTSIKYLHDCISIAALLHDIGHGPFGHQFESTFKDYKVKDLSNELAEPLKWVLSDEAKEAYKESKIKHEHFSYALINVILKETKLSSSFAPVDICCFLDNIFSPSSTLKFHLKKVAKDLFSDAGNELSLLKGLKSILSSDIDADRFDYLQRDSYFCGINITGLDIPHILNSISLEYSSGDGFYIEMKKNASSSLDQLLISRKLMFDQVYLHWKHCYFGDLLLSVLQDYKYVKKANILKSWKEYISYTDDYINDRIKQQIKSISKNKSFSKNEQNLALLFFNISPQKCHMEKVSADSFEIECQKLEGFYQGKNKKVYGVPLGKFSSLKRQFSKTGNSILKVKTNLKKEILTSYNSFSDIFQSNLWDNTFFRLTVADSEEFTFTKHKADIHQGLSYFKPSIQRKKSKAV